MVHVALILSGNFLFLLVCMEEEVARLFLLVYLKVHRLLRVDSWLYDTVKAGLLSGILGVDTVKNLTPKGGGLCTCSPC